MKNFFKALIYYFNCLRKYKYLLLLLNSFLFFFFGIGISLDFDICFCENNEEKVKIVTQEEKNDLRVSSRVFLKVLKYLIILSLITGFVIMLPFLILMWDIANAHRYERYIED
jgi:hypothetical protein